jgi:hypothetical protein
MKMPKNQNKIAENSIKKKLLRGRLDWCWSYPILNFRFGFLNSKPTPCPAPLPPLSLILNLFWSNQSSQTQWIWQAQLRFGWAWTPTSDGNGALNSTHHYTSLLCATSPSCLHVAFVDVIGIALLKEEDATMMGVWLPPLVLLMKD